MHCNKSLLFYMQSINLLCWTVAEKSIMKNYLITEKLQYWLHGKKEKITKQENKHDNAGYLSHDTTCHFILYIKYELSILNSCGDIFDEKCREKEKWINIVKNKKMLVLNRMIQLDVVCLYTKFEHSI